MMTPDVMTLVGHIVLGILGVAQVALTIWNNKLARSSNDLAKTINRNTNGKNGHE